MVTILPILSWSKFLGFPLFSFTVSPHPSLSLVPAKQLQQWHTLAIWWQCWACACWLLWWTLNVSVQSQFSFHWRGFRPLINSDFRALPCHLIMISDVHMDLQTFPLLSFSMTENTPPPPPRLGQEICTYYTQGGTLLLDGPKVFEMMLIEFGRAIQVCINVLF